MQSLYFLLPFLVLYEVGAWQLWQEQGGPLTAHRMIWEFFESLGIAGGVHLPAIVLVVVMLSKHIVKKTDPWAPEPKLYVGMAFESLVFAAPLFVMMTVLFGRSTDINSASALAQVITPGGPEGEAVGPWAQWRASVVVALGAGIYEEIIFRMFAILALHVLTKDLLALPEEVCVLTSVIVSSLAFALIHFNSQNPFDAGKMLFYFLVGIYFAAIYWTRGMGIVVAVHVLYDVLVFSKAMYQQG